MSKITGGHWLSKPPKKFDEGPIPPYSFEEFNDSEWRKKIYRDIEEENLRYKLSIPSKTGFKKVTLDGRMSSTNKLKRLIDERGNIKHGLGTHIESTLRKKEMQARFLYQSADEFVNIVENYCHQSRPQPFNWLRKKFPESVKWMSKRFEENPDGSILRSYEDAYKLSYCDSDLSDSACVPPSWNEIWREFQEFAKETPEHQQINLELVEELKSSIELGHPIVSVIGEFAVAAFNEACEMHVKKDEPNNLHDFEVMECKYLKTTNAFHFYMIIEAIEEGNLGIYETQVICHTDGNRSLRKFILTDRNPAGTKAMAVSQFSWVMSFCETLPCDTKEKESKLGKIFDATIGTGPDHGTVLSLLDFLQQVLGGTIKDLHKVLSLGLRLVFSQNCNRTTNPDDWSHPDNHFISKMVRRTKGTPCCGYDYVNPVDLGR